MLCDLWLNLHFYNLKTPTLYSGRDEVVKMSAEPIPWLKLCRFFERVSNGKKGKPGCKHTKFPDKEKKEFLSCTVLPPSRALSPGG